MKNKWESPTGAGTSCAFGDSHFALPRLTGGGGLCSFMRTKP